MYRIRSLQIFFKEYNSMHQNCSQHLLPLPQGVPEGASPPQHKEGNRGDTPNIIHFSQDNSNHSQDKSNRLPAPTAEDSDQKENKLDQNSEPPGKVSLQQENISEKHSDFDKKSEPTKNGNKDLPSSQKNISAKCWNKLCLAKGVKRIKSRVTGRYLWLCSGCANGYCLEQYCEFCEQIYAQEEVDGLEWIECETKGCGRWNHTTCQKQYSNFAEQDPYFCTKCREDKTRHLRIPAHNHHESESVASEKTNKLTSKDQSQNNVMERVKVFHSQFERFGALESMLTTYSYKLSIPEDQMRQDNLLGGKEGCSKYNEYAKPVKRSKYKR